MLLSVRQDELIKAVDIPFDRGELVDEKVEPFLLTKGVASDYGVAEQELLIVQGH